MKLFGYKRENDTFGIRNHLLVIPASVCAGETASRIAAMVPGAVAIPHQHGCCQVGDDYRQTFRTLAGFGSNANVGAVLVVGLGCEGINSKELAEVISLTKKPVEHIIIQENNGTLGTVSKGAEILSRMAADLSKMQKVQFDISELILGLECGGSDPTSGIASNPAIGKASDMLISLGGSSILSETTEVIGAEHLLVERFDTDESKRRFLKMVDDVEKRAIAMGEDLRGTQPTPGNIQGGLTTIEEKSLGCMHKAGTSFNFVDALEYAQAVPKDKKGLYFMDTPGEDIDSITGMVAGGAQIVVFTTGRGTPTGCPIAPVIKITGNTEAYQKMKDNIDINAGKIITDGATLDEIGREIFDKITEVSNGSLTKAEILGHREFGVYRIGYTF
ncbi:MAG: UxaA family hydrolase [Sedimentibacter sp.]|uniref:UxaA family hydrolase n=1 Tax=Sedimentibacter sp. TaxID=1960295 RepID=UPI00315967FA